MNISEQFNSYAQRIGLLPQDIEFLSKLLQKYGEEQFNLGVDSARGSVPVDSIWDNLNFSKEAQELENRRKEAYAKTFAINKKKELGFLDNGL